MTSRELGRKAKVCQFSMLFTAVVIVAVILIAEFGCASGGKLAGAVPINIEAPDTATADHGSAASTGWFNLQSTGGSIGIAVVSVASLGFMAWALTKLYNRFVCRYVPPCDRMPPKH